MRVALFCHSIVSDWNHRDAGFLRGVVRELGALGHGVAVFEPAGGWSLMQLLRGHGVAPIKRLGEIYPGLDSTPYDLDRLDLDEVLDGVDLVVVHEWTEPELVRRIGAHHARARDYSLFFHDPDGRAAEYELHNYDAVLSASSWPDAVDTKIFRPHVAPKIMHDLLWIGRPTTDPLLLNPVRQLVLDAHAYGERYSNEDVATLAKAGIEYGGWIPNYELPRTIAAHRVAVHIPPPCATRETSTIRVLEALACAVPLICAPTVVAPLGVELLIGQDPGDMTRKIRSLLSDRDFAVHMTSLGLEAVRAHHTCEQRAQELLAFHRRIRAEKLAARSRSPIGMALG